MSSVSGACPEDRYNCGIYSAFDYNDKPVNCNSICWENSVLLNNQYSGKDELILQVFLLNRTAFGGIKF